MKKVSSRKHDRFGRVLDSDPVYLIAALALMALLVSFYAVLLVNMNAIDTKTEDLKEHPYAVTVAAGRAETLLMQVRTLDNRLAFARTPETVASVKTEFASIDENLRTAFRVVEQRHHGNPEKVKDLVSNYEEFSELQDRLIALSLSDADDEAVAAFLASEIDPRIDRMLEDNQAIISAAARSFDQLYKAVGKTRQDTMFTASVLMTAMMVALVLFLAVIKRKNRQERELQESLRCAMEKAQDASEAKSRFLSNVSHDIRTPLTAIMGLVDIAVEHIDERDRVKECFDKVQLSSHHLLNLVNDVLDMSKIESGQINLCCKPFDLHVVVETLGSIVRPQADSKHLTFSVLRVDVEEGLVLGDEMHVNQVLINLLGNAVKYTEPSGTVSLAVEELRGDERVEYAAQHGLSLEPTSHDGFDMCIRLIRFIVEDDGIGMSKEFMSRLFDPFECEEVPTRLSVEGTGLGLSIVKNLADLMGGTVQVQSERGRGSRFTLVLPFEACEGDACKLQLEESIEAERSDAAVSAVSCSWQHVHVLLAEDNEIIGEIAEEIIASTGATVERAWNGLDVLDLLEGAPEGRFDLVFMDIQMPGMDGLEAARLVVERYREAGRARPPIIATTANAYEEDRRRALDAGMDGFAVKPIGKSEVCHLFATFVDAKIDE